jgi:hypothetical protein
MPNYKITIFKSWGTFDEDNSWTNTYEVQSADTSPDGPELSVMFTNIIQAEQDIHLSEVYFLRCVISTWNKDSSPYNPAGFRTVPLSVRGTRTLGTGQAVDSSLCFYVRRQVALGHYGKLLYRGVLLESDMRVKGDLSAELEDASPLRTGGVVWQNYYTSLQPWFGSSGTAGLVLVREDGFGDQEARRVTDLVPGGIVVKRRNNRFFNRGTPTP